MKVKIEKLDNLGNGITYVNDKIIFVPNTLPDEICDINIVEEKKKIQFGKCENIIEKSEKRVTPCCPYYESCGGCQLQHISYEDSLKFKLDRVENALKRANIKFNDISIEKCDNEFYYRNKITLKVINGVVGYYSQNSHSIVPIKKCMIANQTINNVLNEINLSNKMNGEIIIRVNDKEEVLIIAAGNIKLSKDDFSSNIKIAGIVINNKLTYGEDYLITKVNEYSFKYSYDSFFQTNYNICGKLLDFVKENSVDGNILDLYCGVGSLGMAASNNKSSVFGIEVIPNAIKNANYNKKINNKDNMEFVLGDVSKLIENVHNDYEMVILDPPRKGLDKNTISYIKNNFFKKIIYISCSLDSLIRDLPFLLDLYNIEKIKVFDMFPYTNHVESLVVLERIY